MAIHRLGIHRVDGQARFQQSGDEQPMARFNNARQLLLPFWSPCDAKQEGSQLGQALDCVCHLLGCYLLSLLIDHDDHMMRIGPIDASVPHRSLPSMLNGSWRSVALYNSARSTTLYHRSTPGVWLGKDGLYTTVEPWGVSSLSSATGIGKAMSLTVTSTRGLFQV
jgi:hypothetical protein